MSNHLKSEVIIIGAGAAGLMCAIEAAKRGRQVLVLDHANKAGKKILMSGGGRCNFTNYNASAANFISHNPHFCKSALSRYTARDFIDLVEEYNISYHEKAKGQLFCDNKSKDIVDMLLAECEKYKVSIKLNKTIENISAITDHEEYKFKVIANNIYLAESLVIATGGLSIPTMGASNFAYKIAQQFGINVYPTRAGLVPITLQNEDKEIYSQLSGISCKSIASSKKKKFAEDFLFTHRGISGPAILQISNYWLPGENLIINLCPDITVGENFLAKFSKEISLKNFLLEYLGLAKKIVTFFLDKFFPDIKDTKLKSLSEKVIKEVIFLFQNWELKPNGTEGYRTAEVTIGGIDCDEISSKTMEAKNIPKLYFIGECLDVTGWLGGYNFQWAWSSGYVAAQYV